MKGNWNNMDFTGIKMKVTNIDMKAAMIRAGTAGGRAGSEPSNKHCPSNGREFYVQRK